MPPLFIVALGALGAAALVKVIAAESRRVNDTLKRQQAADAGELKTIPLERDPKTGDYRPRQG
ncbi:MULTISPECIES: hypothetical protein [unclassified Xanthobacter]|uniref:hypothetical protein n=1 Tax=unclassified Xanthobacter TaxID=2623496 RepID=UPI001EDF3C0D